VDGAVYYWTTSNPPRIMRFDFGSQSGLAPVLQPSDLPSDSGTPGAGTRCVGCHSLSAGGGRMAAASGTSYESYLVYLNDLTLPRTATSNWLTVDGRNNGPASQNRVLITSFNPDGSEFVAVPPNGDGTATPNSLLFHDGATGLRKTTSDGTLSLTFTPAFPAWSPDGGAISVTHIYGSNKSTIEFQEGGISVITQGTAG
jgi:Tol biopolymer transport system component